MPECLLACASMNIIIEDAETLNYFTGEGRWSKSATEGKPYASADHAFAAARNEPIGKFNITGYIAETRQLINIRSGRGIGSQSMPPATLTEECASGR